MARQTILSNAQKTQPLAEVRTVVGVIVADNAALTDANFPPANGVAAAMFDSVFVGVEILGGTLPTATIELLIRDESAPDGQRWKKIGVVDSGALDGNTLAEMTVNGQPLIYPRIKAVANPATTTQIKILIAPGKIR